MASKRQVKDDNENQSHFEQHQNRVQFNPISVRQNASSYSRCSATQLSQAYHIPVLPEPCQQAVLPEPCQQAVLPEPCQQAVLHQRSQQAVFPEPCQQAVFPEPCQQAVFPEPCQQAVFPEPCQQAKIPKQRSDDIGSYIQTSHSIWLIKSALVPSSNPEQLIPFPDMPSRLVLVPPNFPQPSSQGQVQSGPRFSYRDQSTASGTWQQTNMLKGGNSNSAHYLVHETSQRSRVERTPSANPPFSIIKSKPIMSSLDEEFLFENNVKIDGNCERTSIGELHHSHFRTTNLTKDEKKLMANDFLEFCRSWANFLARLLKNSQQQTSSEEILRKIKTILSRMDFIHFHSFSRILLLIWKYPSVEHIPYERVLPVLETLNYLEEQKNTNATESFGRCLKFGTKPMRQIHREAWECLFIPCCFLVGISNSEGSLKKRIEDRLDLIVVQTRQSFDISPCAAFINLSSKFLKNLLKICANPTQKLQFYYDNLGYVKSTKYISESGKLFLEFYMTEYLMDCSKYYNAFDCARFYKSLYYDLAKSVQEKLYEHFGKRQN